MYDLIVVGSGFCGSVVSDLAAKKGKRVLVLEKRNHIAGNMYDQWDSNGILVQKYGPHIVHTSNERVHDYLLSKGDWFDYTLYYGVDIDGKCLSAPFGFHTADHFYDFDRAEALKRQLASCYQGSDSVPILELLASGDPDIRSFANMLYEKNYLPYALKQWRLKPEELQNEIIGRMPIILSDRQNYFTDTYEMLPKKGFSVFFQGLLNSPNIDVELNIDATTRLRLDDDKRAILFDGCRINVPVVYTGTLEKILLGRVGVLPYRSLRFEYRQFSQPRYQERALVTYPQRFEYLRTSDYNQLAELPSASNTTVSFEYPIPYAPLEDYSAEPYYPVLTSESVHKNQELIERASRFENFFPCGRLADFRYYNMDQAIERAFEVFNVLCRKYWGDSK